MKLPEVDVVELSYETRPFFLALDIPVLSPTMTEMVSPSSVATGRKWNSNPSLPAL